MGFGGLYIVSSQHLVYPTAWSWSGSFVVYSGDLYFGHSGTGGTAVNFAFAGLQCPAFTPTPSSTATPTFTATSTRTSTPTNTPVNTATPTLTPTRPVSFISSADVEFVWQKAPIREFVAVILSLMLLAGMVAGTRLIRARGR